LGCKETIYPKPLNCEQDIVISIRKLQMDSNTYVSLWT